MSIPQPPFVRSVPGTATDATVTSALVATAATLGPAGGGVIGRRTLGPPTSADRATDRSRTPAGRSRRPAPGYREPGR
ncbi:hypothetical protein BRC68_07945 [Halobacteriales archaeon QH_6_64_20]|nr:MAG: hypothetical protein BRC68_07945 [Halobacteriales archaeon QH_6_64_20]